MSQPCRSRVAAGRSRGVPDPVRTGVLRACAGRSIDAGGVAAVIFHAGCKVISSGHQQVWHLCERTGGALISCRCILRAGMKRAHEMAGSTHAVVRCKSNQISCAACMPGGWVQGWIQGGPHGGARVMRTGAGGVFVDVAAHNPLCRILYAGIGGLELGGWEGRKEGRFFNVVTDNRQPSQPTNRTRSTPAFALSTCMRRPLTRPTVLGPIGPNVAMAPTPNWPQRRCAGRTRPPGVPRNGGTRNGGSRGH